MSVLRVVAGAVGTTIGALALLMLVSWFYALMPLWGPVVLAILVVGARQRAREQRPEDDRG